MKINNRKAIIKRLSTYLLTMLVLASILSISTFAAGGTPSTPSTPTNPGIVLQNYDGNTIVRTIVNALVGVMTMAGVVYGGFQLFMGFNSDDSKEKRTGIIAIISSFAVGGLIIAVVNMMLA